MNYFVKISILLAGVAVANEAECDCYATTGVTSATYIHRIYHDFRYLDNTGSLYNDEPANITNDQDSSAAPIQPGFLASDAFVND